tara:strand:- start:165 stop:389 length:225 start_codon:yes stop_codon:yes gene_type:complete
MKEWKISMTILTREQVLALYSIYHRDWGNCNDKPSTYLQFRRSVTKPIKTLDDAVFVQFCGMTLGIECDGYTHS